MENSKDINIDKNVNHWIDKEPWTKKERKPHQQRKYIINKLMQRMNVADGFPKYFRRRVFI